MLKKSVRMFGIDTMEKNSKDSLEKKQGLFSKKWLKTNNKKNVDTKKMFLMRCQIGVRSGKIKGDKYGRLLGSFFSADYLADLTAWSKLDWGQSINAQVFKNCKGTTLYFGGSKAEAKRKL